MKWRKCAVLGIDPRGGEMWLRGSSSSCGTTEAERAIFRQKSGDERNKPDADVQQSFQPALRESPAGYQTETGACRASDFGSRKIVARVITSAPYLSASESHRPTWGGHSHPTIG
jgi:hypothetical protein